MQPTQNPVAEKVITPADTLRGAALYLIRHGWSQGDMFDLMDPDEPFPPACGLGAIRMATFGSAEVIADLITDKAVEDFNRAVTAFVDHLVLSYGVNADVNGPAAVSLISQDAREELAADWNDDSSRIKAHVIAALKGAADQWDRLHRGSAMACPRCSDGCPGNNYNGYADPGAFGYCGCGCHTGGAA